MNLLRTASQMKWDTPLADRSHKARTLKKIQVSNKHTFKLLIYI